MRLLPRPQLDSIETRLAEVMHALPEGDGACGLRDAIARYVTQGGKRVRPQLALWTYHRATGADDADDAPPALLDLACAWELFHAFLLIHDDIIDGAERRRDRPSLHRELCALDGGSETFGRNLAIVAGDLLFGEAMRLFHEVDGCSPDVYRRETRLFSRVARQTGFGQAVDICQSHAPLDGCCEQRLLREYHWKTAAYTFEGPMLTGAIYAGASDAVQARVSQFALAIGQAYQVQNDLVDLAAPAHEGCDLLQGKRTLTLLRHRAGLCESSRRAFDERFLALPRLNGSAVKVAETLRREVLAGDAPRATAAMIDRLLAEAEEVASAEVLPTELRRGLVDLLDGMRATYFIGARRVETASV